MLAARVKTKTKEAISWESLPVEKRAFDLANSKLANIIPLTILCDKYPLRITTDASHFGIGATIESFIDGEWRITNFYSKRLDASVVRTTSAMKKYSKYSWCILTLERFKEYVLSCPIVYLRTDCKSLVYLYSSSIHTSDSKSQRWLSRLGEFQLTYVHHIPRELNQTSDTLSNRFPAPDQVPHTHFVKYAFSKAKRSQMKIDFKEGETFTQDQFKKLVLENPDCICKPEDGGSEDMVTEKIPPCSFCAAEGYDLSVEKVEQITSDRSTDTKYELEEFDRKLGIWRIANTKFLFSFNGLSFQKY